MVTPASFVVVNVYVVAGTLPVGPGLPTGPAPTDVPKGAVLAINVVLKRGQTSVHGTKE
jgi:hypothetical protein